MAALLRSASEAALFAVIYQAVRLISGSPLPAIAEQANLSRADTFLLMLLAVAAIQLTASGSRVINGIHSGRCAARCQAEVLPLIQSPYSQPQLRLRQWLQGWRPGPADHDRSVSGQHGD